MTTTMRDVKVELFLAEPMVLARPLPPLNPGQMKCVYWMGLAVSQDATDADVLDAIFCTFNMNHPADYHHRSLSAGDVVTLDGERSFLCDVTGWKRLDYALRALLAS